jgi:hypothetical protein
MRFRILIPSMQPPVLSITQFRRITSYCLLVQAIAELDELFAARGFPHLGRTVRTPGENALSVRGVGNAKSARRVGVGRSTELALPRRCSSRFLDWPGRYACRCMVGSIPCLPLPCALFFTGWVWGGFSGSRRVGLKPCSSCSRCSGSCLESGVQARCWAVISRVA